MAKMNSYLGSRKMLKLFLMVTSLLVVFANKHQVRQQSLLQSNTGISYNEQYDARDRKPAANRDINNRIVRNNEHEEKTIEIETRRLYNPSDHYFCGVGFADASESCTHPCPGGSTSE